MAQHALDVEVAEHQGALDLGAFCDTGMMGVEEVQRLLERLVEELERMGV